MRIRLPFAAAFVFLLIFASSIGLLPHSALPSAPEAARPYIPAQSDKAAHFIIFFALSAVFYFILDTGRRRVLHLTLIVCTLLLAVGSEVVQGQLPNGRDFDPWDVLANVIGSVSAVGLANAYHKRSLERRRRAKYSSLTGDGMEDGDLELGEGLGASGGEDELGRQENGTIAATRQEVGAKTVEEELDHWDENMPDDEWDEEEEGTSEQSKNTPATSSAGTEDAPKKVAVD